ncbi:MAG: hypothetical protein E6G01_06155 [Actinobacteria bacterium]|nr:MAG: hypothetical protein E6G01_06155 [Actinomycetota bacterium]
MATPSNRKDHAMFSVHCPRHGKRVLLAPDGIEALVNDGGSIAVRWVCWCGARGTERFGRGDAETSPIACPLDADPSRIN